jgi:hypothetical protein
MLSAAFAVIAEVPGGWGPRAKGEGEARRGTGRHAGSGSGKKVGAFRRKEKRCPRRNKRPSKMMTWKFHIIYGIHG